MPISKLAAIALASTVLCSQVGFAQIEGNRADHGSKGSRTVGPTAPGATPAASQKGANNPGGMGKGPADMPPEPATGAGLPGSPSARSGQDSAGQPSTTGLQGRPRTGSGGATIDQTSPPNAKGR